MNPIRKLFLPKEVRGAVGVLDELETRFDSEAFHIVRQHVEAGFLRFSKDFVAMVRAGTPVRQIVLQAVSNTTGDLVESGRYHVWRGVLDPFGPGEHLLQIYDATTEDLVQMGIVDRDYADKQRNGLRQNIQSVG